jgi:hypothetical protein
MFSFMLIFYNRRNFVLLLLTSSLLLFEADRFEKIGFLKFGENLNNFGGNVRWGKSPLGEMSLREKFAGETRATKTS